MQSQLIAVPKRKPTSQKQLEANRRNALKSTGPATPRGRAISSQNARKDVPLPGENPALPRQLAVQYFGFFQPATPRERQLVNRMIFLDRLRRHYLALETRASARELREAELARLPDSLTWTPHRTMTVHDQLCSTERSYGIARRELETLRAKAA